MTNNKTKAEQVAELVGKDIALLSVGGLHPRDSVAWVEGESWGDAHVLIELDDNPNTAEQIANALRVLAGEVVE